MSKNKFASPGNILLAAFMELKESNGRWYVWDKENQGQGYFTELCFHRLWSWIMPACKKWDNLEIPKDHQEEYAKLCDDLDAIVVTYEVEPIFDQLVINITWYNKIIAK